MPALRARTLLERGRTHTIVLGAGRTLMLACLSPSSAHLDESMNTLHFASRAKNIANRPAVQIDQQAVPAPLVACATWPPSHLVFIHVRSGARAAPAADLDADAAGGEPHAAAEADARLFCSTAGAQLLHPIPAPIAPTASLRPHLSSARESARRFDRPLECTGAGMRGRCWSTGRARAIGGRGEAEGEPRDERTQAGARRAARARA